MQGQEAAVDRVLELEETIVRPAAYGALAKQAAAVAAAREASLLVEDAGIFAAVVLSCTLSAGSVSSVDLGLAAPLQYEVGACETDPDVVLADARTLQESLPKVIRLRERALRCVVWGWIAEADVTPYRRCRSLASATSL